jgi:hypothetical protein
VNFFEDGKVLTRVRIIEKRMNQWILAECVYVADVPKEMPHRYFERTLRIGVRHCSFSLLLAERLIMRRASAPPSNQSFAGLGDRTSPV